MTKETPILFPIPVEEFWQKLSKIVEDCVSKRLSDEDKPSVQAMGFTTKPLLTIKEVCLLFQITKPTLYEWIKDDRLLPYKIRGRVFFLMADIEKLLKPDQEKSTPAA